jgi:hypothetical protein
LKRIIGYVAFFVSHALLGLAVWCAFREFLHAARMRKVAGSTAQDAEDAENRRVNEITVSLEGVALKTSFHGTFLLVIAILFYYLFLKFVYPINIVSG